MYIILFDPIEKPAKQLPMHYVEF